MLHASQGLTERQILQALDGLTDEEAEAILYDWVTWARPAQLAPDWNWRTWLILAGRGFGKTRTGAEWVRGIKNKVGRIALVGPTASDARDVIVEGESGIMAISPKWDRPTYEPSKRRLTWDNGAQATLYTADEPERLRGPQHGAAWCDELAAWRYLQEAWDMLSFGLRLGTDPQVVVTTTPKPLPLLKALMADPTTHLTRGSTYDNAANLAAPFMAAIIKRYEGTRLGRQELNAEILDDAPGALWQREWFDRDRVPVAPALARIAIGLDPSTTGGDDSDEAGIIAAGLGTDGRGYVLDDKSLQASPNGWAMAAVDLLHKLKANLIVAEINQGGEMVALTIKTVDAKVTVKTIHASQSKQARAEPVASLYEQRRVSHVGSFPKLEDECCQWVPGSGRSPNRLDALVYALTELMLGQAPPKAKGITW